MTKNQAFAILQKSGGIRAARIITENCQKLSWLRVIYMSHLLRRGTPVAKIIHQKWFYGLPFYTNKHTLDPRPDTETLVSAVISDHTSNTPIRILDLGTGTGCIICSLVKNIQNSSGVGADKSIRALRVARRNITALGLSDTIKLHRMDFARPHKTFEKFDIIVSNPPYIAHGDARVDDGAHHDPKIALYAANNGLYAYESIAKNAPHWIKPDGKIYLEIGQSQSPQVKKIFTKNGWRFTESKFDLSGIERVMIFNREQK